MAFGGGVLRGRCSSLNDFAGAGQFTFNGSVTGLGMGDFFPGQPSTFFQGLPNTAASSQNFFNLYFTDSWRVTPRLTFNFGIRWEPYLPMSVTNGQISNFDMGRFLAGAAEQEHGFPERALRVLFPRRPRVPRNVRAYTTNGIILIRAEVWPGIPKGTEKCRFAPATPLAMRTSPAYRARIRVARIPGADEVRSLQTGINFANPYASDSRRKSVSLHRQPQRAVHPGGTIHVTTPYNLPTPTTYSWNFSVQRQIWG